MTSSNNISCVKVCGISPLNKDCINAKAFGPSEPLNKTLILSVQSKEINCEQINPLMSQCTLTAHEAAASVGDTDRPQQVTSFDSVFTETCSPGLENSLDWVSAN